MVDNTEKLKRIAKLVRYYILESTTEAGSGHPTTSLSATDLMTTLMFGGQFKFNPKDPSYANNDRLIFSKGHAAPLLYSLWTAAGEISEKELLTLRKFGSRLEGHPTMMFPFTEAATGSLGQGLSIGLGMALNAKYVDKLPYKTYVLLGDSEVAEGSIWEAIEVASYYKLDNLIGILDVNRLGQRGQTMLGHDIDSYAKRISSFGWQTITIDGHDIKAIEKAYEEANKAKGKPVMIIAKTLKGKGVSFIEDKDNWHGKALNRDEFEKAVKELGIIDKKVKAEIAKPEKKQQANPEIKKINSDPYELGQTVATRKAYGIALPKMAKDFKNIVVLDAEVSNSTYSDLFKKAYPELFFEMFIAEQNMIGAALGFSRRGKIPFCSTFAAFLSRACDQIRMSQYSNPNIKICGSHAGVSIGEDGASQMALEDISMFRAILNSVVLYPSDAVSTEKLVRAAAEFRGLVYIRTTRSETPVIYKDDEEFKIGGSKTIRKSSNDEVTVVGAGITLFEALKAYDQLKAEGISIRVIDLYSIKPLDTTSLKKAAKETKAIITVEDHYEEGGLGEAIKSALSESKATVCSLCVRKMPRSGKPSELLDYEEISKDAIIKKVKQLL